MSILLKAKKYKYNIYISKQYKTYLLGPKQQFTIVWAP